MRWGLVVRAHRGAARALALPAAAGALRLRPRRARHRGALEPLLAGGDRRSLGFARLSKARNPGLTATETTRRIGAFWILIEEAATPPVAMPFARALALGYDATKKRYVGTWVDSFNPTHIGRYEGEMDAAGSTLTLVGEIPHPYDGVRLVKMREGIELKSPDHKVVTKSLQGDDGNWFTLVTVNARRLR